MEQSVRAESFFDILKGQFVVYFSYDDLGAASNGASRFLFEQSPSCWRIGKHSKCLRRLQMTGGMHEIFKKYAAYLAPARAKMPIGARRCL